jgi:hypothetical protein
MERGPLALFGAIVAVGLGPALWLGAQFGHFDVAPTPTSVSVNRTHADTAQLLGGTGAGEKETGDNTSIRTTPRAHIMPLTRSPSPSPSTSSADPSASASASASDDPSGPSDSPSASPSQSTDPTDGGGDDSQPPSPPAADSSSGPGDDGSGVGNGLGNGNGVDVGIGDDSPQAASAGQA